MKTVKSLLGGGGSLVSPLDIPPPKRDWKKYRDWALGAICVIAMLGIAFFA